MFGSTDPDNPMGGLLGDLLKVIGSGPGASDSWFEAARTLAFGVATDGGEDENPDRVAAARIERLTRIGSGVKVALRLADGGPMTVEMPRADALALGLAEGDRVLVDLRHAKLFVEDYSI